VWFNRSSSQLAREPPLPPAAPTGFQSRLIPAGDQWVSHPGRKLTAAAIVAAYSDAENGWPEQQCDIFDDRFEADAHLRDAFQGRNEAVARKEWILVPGGRSDADARAAQLLEEALHDVSGWTRTLEHQLTAIRGGYAYSEILWERVDGRLAVPVHFENVLSRRFRFTDTDEPQLVTDASRMGEALVPGKWWKTELSGRRKAMAGLMRTALWWSWFKTMSTRDWLVFANRYGIPYAYGEYPASFRDEDKTALRTMLQHLGTDGWAIFQEGVKVTISEARKTGGSQEVHGALVTLCNAEISKLVTGATLMNETQGPGSFALGREHGERGFQRVAGDAHLLAESFEQYVGKPFVVYNGIPARPPRLKIHIMRDMDPATRMKVFAVARNDLGIPISMEQVRQEHQLKPPTGADDEAPGLQQGGTDEGRGSDPGSAPA